MSLATAITELESGQSHDQMLSEIKARTVSKLGIAESGYVLAKLAELGKIGTIETIADTNAHPLQEVAKAILITLKWRSGFDFAVSANVTMMAGLVAAGVLTQEEADSISAIGTTTEPEFPSVNLRDVISIREPEKIASVAIESVESQVVICARSQGILATVALSEAAPAQTAVEIWLSISADGDNYTVYRYAGALAVKDQGNYVVSINPQLTAKYNKVKFVSREFVFSFELLGTEVY